MNTKTESFSYNGYSGSSEFSHEDRCLVGQVLYIDDLIMYEADSYEELEKAFKSSVDEYLSFCKEVGKQPQKAYSGSFNVRIGAELHGQAARKAAQLGVTLNEFVRLAVVEKALAASGANSHDMAQAKFLNLLVDAVPLTYAGTMTVTGSSTAAIFPAKAFTESELDRPMLLSTASQVEVTSPADSPIVLEVPSKKPMLRRVA